MTTNTVPGISALQCVISSLRDTAHLSDEGGELTDQLRELRDWALSAAAAQGDALDAARYRWLRKHRSIDLHANPSVPWVVRCEFQPIPTTTAIVGEALDAAIDAARAAQGESK